jgi:pimeloyl-ACP methyl ester carboxylesterase
MMELRRFRWIAPIGIVGLLVICASIAFLAQALLSANDRWRNPAQGTLVDVGGHRLHLICQGTGQPTVVFDAGLGDSHLSWAEVLPQVAQTTRACAYDRAGYGYSDDGPVPRSSARIAAELHSLLTKANIADQVVLVGHSFGGLNVRMYAYQYPCQVAGLVLVDPSHEDQLPSWPPSVADRYAERLSQACRNVNLARIALLRIRGETSADSSSVPPTHRSLAIQLGMSTSWARSVCEELKTFTTTSADQLRASRRLLEIPMIVIDGNFTMEQDSRRAGYSMEDARARESVWHQLHRELAQTSSRGRLVVASGSSHNVHVDQMALVVTEVNRVVTEVRRAQE